MTREERKQALDWFNSRSKSVTMPGAKRMYLLAIEALSAEKTGRWIDAVLPNDNGGLPVQVCDQCNTFFPLAYTGGGHRFCPSCGARMEGTKCE